ncbi:unnamed protein product [Discula destructiva]
MSDLRRTTENLILQESKMVQKRGGKIGACRWSYVDDANGKKTIEPEVGFYLSPPPHARCRWSTAYGRFAPRHINANNDGNGDAMPPRKLLHWNDDILLFKFNEYRSQHWADLQRLARPNNFEDLFELFDASTLWTNGAYNLWTVVNMLVTHAHNEYPHVLQDWKDYSEQVVQDYFRVVPGPCSSPSSPDNMQLQRNQMHLRNWDQKMDPLLLLHHTNFPIHVLHQMNIQQHGLLRESLIREFARLTGMAVTFPISSSSGRAQSSTVIPPYVKDQVQGASIYNAIQADSSNTAIEQASSCSPLVIVETLDPSAKPSIQSPAVKESATTTTENQSPARTSPPSVPLASIPEESTSARADDLANTSETLTSDLPSKTKVLSSEAKPFIPRQVLAELTSLAGNMPSEAETAAPTTVAEHTKVEVSAAEPNTEKAFSTVEAQVEAPFPGSATMKVTPALNSPIRDRKDSNGSTDKLFFPDALSEKLRAARQPSISSAPDLNTPSMLTVAENNEQSPSETPLLMPVNLKQQQLPLRPVSTNSAPNEISDQLLRFPANGRNQAGQQAGPIGRQTHSTQQQGSHTGPSTRNTTLTMTPHGLPLGMAQMPGAFNPDPSCMHPVPDNLFSQYGLSAPASLNMRMAPPMGPHGVGPHAGPHMAPNMASPIRSPPFQEQMPSHMNQHHLGPHQPSMTTPGYQPNGYIQHPQNFRNQVEQGNYGYSNNGYRRDTNPNSYGDFNGLGHEQRRNSNQSNAGSRKRVNSFSRPDQTHRRSGPWSPCNNQEARNIRHEVPHEVLYDECPCSRCVSASRTVFVSVNIPQGNETEVRCIIMKHFAAFKPITAKRSWSHTASLKTWFVE